MASYALLKSDHTRENLEQLLLEVTAVVTLEELEHTVDRVREITVVGL